MWTAAVITNLKVQSEILLQDVGRTVGGLQRSAQYLDPVPLLTIIDLAADIDRL
jgi:hypothetical protein